MRSYGSCWKSLDLAHDSDDGLIRLAVSWWRGNIELDCIVGKGADAFAVLVDAGLDATVDVDSPQRFCLRNFRERDHGHPRRHGLICLSPMIENAKPRQR